MFACSGGRIEPSPFFGGLRTSGFYRPRCRGKGGSLESLLLGEATPAGVWVLDELPVAAHT